MLNIPFEVLLGDFVTLLNNVGKDQVHVLATLRDKLNDRIEELSNGEEDTSTGSDDNTESSGDTSSSESNEG